MLPSSITLDTHVYDLVVQRATSSERSVAAQPVDKPWSLIVSHDVSKSNRVNSLIQLSDVIRTVPEPCGSGCTVPSTDTIKVHMKISYDRVSSRADVKAAVLAQVALLVEFAENSSLMDKVLNLES